MPPESADIDPRLQPDLDRGRRFLAAHPPPGRPLLVAVTGAHLYGFPSVDSDLDLKGIHLAPTRSVLGLSPTDAAHDRLRVFEGQECDLTTQELGRAASLLLKGNGNLLEQITSPLQLLESPELKALREVLPCALSRRVHAHYRGYLRGMRRELARERRAKSLLYAYRVVLTGLHALKAGEIEAHLPTLASLHGVTGPSTGPLDDLIAWKQAGEKRILDPDLADGHEAELDRLARALDDALPDSVLPESPPDPAAVEDLVVRFRVAEL